MTVKVRFAPSPTGKVHIGNIRTAIFNWLFARHLKGEFLVRVEDTDKERSTQEAIDKLFECMEWLGLDYDGKLYYQSQHEEDHKQAIDKLVSENKAYVRTEANGEMGPTLFRIPFYLDDCKYIVTKGQVEQNLHSDVPLEIDYTGVKFAQISKKGKPVEFNGCLAGFKDLVVYDSAGEVIYNLTNTDVDAVFSKHKFIKFENCGKISYTRREIVYDDLVKGRLSKPLDSIKDLVIARSDGSPIFHLANVWDDAAQGVTHIIRGDDHVENTYRHILLFYTMGYETPLYGHMPMIVNKQGKPYSKRDGDAFVGDFQKKGILSSAMFNYLSLLGWSPGDDRENMTKQEMVNAFTLERVKSSPAQFDLNKLLNMNGSYMSELEKDVFLKLVTDEAEAQGWFSEAIKEKFTIVASLMQGRTKQISQIYDWKYFFFNDSPIFCDGAVKEVELSEKVYIYDPKPLKKVLGKPENIAGIVTVAELFDGVENFTSADIENAVREAERRQGLQEGKLNQAVRIAVTGKSGGADLVEILSIIGKENVIIRMNKIIDLLK
jgi:glutamyl-tRNA synthetase